MKTHYNYIKPKQILKRVKSIYKGTIIKKSEDIFDWIWKQLFLINSVGSLNLKK